MAATMLNFGGKISATVVNTNNNGSCVISRSGTSDSAFALRSERTEGSTIIIFSMVLNNIRTDNTNVDVDLYLVENNNINNKISVGKSITLVPGRPVSLDYKITMTPTNSLYVIGSTANSAEIVISTVQM